MRLLLEAVIGGCRATCKYSAVLGGWVVGTSLHVIVYVIVCAPRQCYDDHW